MRTIVYVDGFNLYYGLLRGTSWLWLDLEKFARSLLIDKYEIVGIKFFTARLRSENFALFSPHDQSCYLEALAANPLVAIIEGSYKRFRLKAPFAKEPCVSCSRVELGTVWKTEEKKSDVNLAVEMVSDAYEDKADAFVLISGDSDHTAALATVRHRCGKTTVVFNPHGGDCVELRSLSTFYRPVPRDLPGRCQLPDEVVTPSRTIRRPAQHTRRTACSARRNVHQGRVFYELSSQLTISDWIRSRGVLRGRSEEMRGRLEAQCSLLENFKTS